MSSESLAARLGRILTKNPESDGLLDEQVEEFLNIYDQVSSSVKADSKQLDRLLERSKLIARSLDEYDMPHLTVTVQGFKFNPPSIQSDLPCQLEFRILPGSGKQILTVQDADKQEIATSGILDPQHNSRFTTTICNPGSYTFTSEIYPFMEGHLTAAAGAATADTAAGGDVEQTVAAGKPSPAADLSIAAGNQHTPAKGVPGQQDQQHQDQQRQVPLTVDAHDINHTASTGFSSRTNAVQPATSSSLDEGAPLQGVHLSDAADGLLLQPSEAGMLELLSLPPAPQHQHPVDAQHVSYQGESSRAGPYARRATYYDDEHDMDYSSEAAVANHTPEPSAATAHSAVINSAQGDSNQLLHSAVAAAAAATSAAHGDASMCSSAAPMAARSLDRNVSCEGPVDMEIDDHGHQLQLQQQHGPAPIGFAKGLEGIEASLRFSPEPTTETVVSGDTAKHCAETAAIASSSSDTTEQRLEQQQSAGDDDGAFSDSSISSAAAAGGYEPLPSNSEPHSSASSDAGDSDSTARLSDGGSGRRASVTGEGLHLLAQGTQNGGRQQPRRTWVTAATAAMGGTTSDTWAQRRSSRSSRPDSLSDSNEGSTSESSADGDVRLRSVRAQHWQQRQQQTQNETLQLEDVSDEDYDPTFSSAAAQAVQAATAKGAAAAAGSSAAARSSGVAVQTELPPIRRPYRGLTAADAIASSAAGRAGPTSNGSSYQEPPGGKWTLGGKAAFAAGSSNGSYVRSTFTSTTDLPGDSNGSTQPSSSKWVVTGGLGSGATHSSLQQATAAAAAGAEKLFSNANESYFSKHVLRHKGTPSTGAAFGSGNSLGPGKYVLSSSSSSKAHVDDPSAQYAALSSNRSQPGVLGRSSADIHAYDDSDEEPAEVRVRAQRLLQQQQAAAARQASLEQQQQQQQQQQQGSQAATSSTGAAKAAAASRKKKGRKAVAAPAAAAVVGKDKSAADARRREREEIEYALYDRGSGSRVNSEDEAPPAHRRPNRLSGTLAAAAATAGGSRVDDTGLSSTAEAARELTKCKFKSCKLLFASDVNKHRCHMSHLPSARNATTKTYKAEVLAFLRALPQLAVAQLLQLPEPSQLPRRQAQLQQLVQQHSRGAKGSSVAAAAAGSSTAAAIERLQGMSLADAWSEQSTLSGDAAVQRSDALLLVSELAQLCCGSQHRPAGVGGADTSDDEAGPALSKHSELTSASAAPLDAATPTAEKTAAAALAAAYAEVLHGACCPSCSSDTGRSADRILDCSCSCHPAVQHVAPSLPSLDHVIALLERASEGTWLCNPRLLQQPHTPSCSCSVCVGIVAAASGSSKPGSSSHQDGSAAVMESIKSGLDILDVFGEWNVDDASLSYAVERRLVTAFHEAKDAEARRVMEQLLDDSETSTSTTTQLQQPPAATAAKKKDKKKASKAAKSTSSKKVPAWKVASSEHDSSAGSDVGQQQVQATTAADAAAAGAAGLVRAHTPKDTDEAVYDSPSKGKYVAEQLLQARLLQQDQELHQLRSMKQQQQDHAAAAHMSRQHQGRPLSKHQQPEQQQQYHQRRLQPAPPPRQPAPHAAHKQQVPAAAGVPARKGAAAAAGVSVIDRRGSSSKPSTPRELQAQDLQQQHQGGYSRHKRTSSSGSGSGATAAASGPAVLVVPRRRNSDVGSSSRRAEQQPPPPPPPPPAPAAAVAPTPATSREPTASAAAAAAVVSCTPSAADTTQQQALQQIAAPAGQAAGGPSAAPVAATAAAQSSAADPSAATGDAAAVQQVQPAGDAAASVVQPAADQPGADADEPDVGVSAAPTTLVCQPAGIAEVYVQQQPQQLPAQQHPLMLLQQQCMTYAQQQAYQQLLVTSGRAAALVSGQEAAPFSAEEQQLLAEWYACYYQHAYAAASHMHLMQQQQHILQQQQQQLAPAAAEAALGQPMVRGETPGSSSPELQQREQQQSPMQLQFGSFPADFTLSPENNGKVIGTSPPSAVAEAVLNAETGRQASKQQHYMQQQQAVQDSAAAQYEYWYQQQQQYMQYMQQQQQLQSISQQQQQQQQGLEGSPGQLASQEEAMQQPDPTGRSHSSFLAQVSSVLQARPAGSKQASAGNKPSHPVFAWGTGPFNARAACELLDSRWAAITAVYGSPQQHISSDSRVAAASRAASNGDRSQDTASVSSQGSPAASSAVPDSTAAPAEPAAVPPTSDAGANTATHKRDIHRSLFHSGRGSHHAGSSTHGWGTAAEGRGRGRGGGNSVWRAKQR